jgi:hypothetical protein
MKPAQIFIVLFLTALAWRYSYSANAVAQTSAPAAAKPGILIELFTSEGCSSCPPADALLRELDRTTRPDVELIVLGEHVDYWDGQGWRDRFSSSQFTERQNRYVRSLHLANPYTPQMVVDGSREFVGNDAAALNSALSTAASLPKTELRISLEQQQNGVGDLRIEAGPLPAASKAADLYLAQADNADETEVAGGENSGRRLYHAAVARSLRKIGAMPEGAPHFETEIPIKKTAPGKARLIVFLQEQGSGRILGAAKLLE